MSERLKIASGSVATALQMVVGFGAMLVFTRFLSSAQLGLYFFVLSVVSTTDGVSGGIWRATKKRISEHDSPRDEILGFILSGGILVTVVTAVIVSVGVWLIRNLESSLFVLVVFIPFVMSTVAVNSIIAIGEVGRAKWLQSGRTLFRVLAQGVGILAFSGITGMIVGHSLAMLTGSALGLFLFSRMAGISPQIPSRDVVESLWEFARYSIPGSFVSRIDESADEMMMGIVFLTGVVGYYGVAARLVMPALILPSVIQSSLSARLSNLDSRGADIIGIMRKDLAYCGLISIPMFFGALSVGDHIVITAFSSEYADAYPFLIVLCGGYVFKSFASPMASSISSLDRPDLNIRLDSVSAVVVVIGAPVLGIVYGPIAFAGGIALSSVVKWVGSIYYLSDYISLEEFAPRQIFEQIIASVFMFGALEMWDSFIGVSGWTDVGIMLSLCGLVYPVSLLVISPETRSVVDELLVSRLSIRSSFMR